MKYVIIRGFLHSRILFKKIVWLESSRRHPTPRRHHIDATVPFMSNIINPLMIFDNKYNFN
jgi:hypothetical protein